MLTVIRKNLWLVFLVLGLIGFLIVWNFHPHQSEIDSIWNLIFKLIVYGCIVGSIAFFPNHSKKGYLLVILPFFAFLGYLLPQVSYYGFTGAVITSNYELANTFYILLYMLLFPMIVFSITLAYRMGGGSPGNCFKIALSGLIILFSGFLDVLWYIVNPVDIPEALVNASHISIFFGRPATYTEGIYFMFAHIPLIVLLLILPLDKWFQAISARLQSGQKTPNNKVITK